MLSKDYILHKKANLTNILECIELPSQTINFALAGVNMVFIHKSKKIYLPFSNFKVIITNTKIVLDGDIFLAFRHVWDITQIRDTYLMSFLIYLWQFSYLKSTQMDLRANNLRKVIQANVLPFDFHQKTSQNWQNSQRFFSENQYSFCCC